jgi:hypothetical protein
VAAGCAVVRDELARSLDELASQLHGLTALARHFGRATPGERPLITPMLGWRQGSGRPPGREPNACLEFQRGAIGATPTCGWPDGPGGAAPRRFVDLAAAEAK